MEAGDESVLLEPPQLVSVFPDPNESYVVVDEAPESLPRTPRRTPKRRNAPETDHRGEFLKIAKQQATAMQVILLKFKLVFEFR